jgi:hypothetical protein
MLWAHGVGSAQCGAGDVCLTAEVEHDSDGRPWDWLLVYLARGVASGPSYLRRLLLALQYPSRFCCFRIIPPIPPTPSCMRTLDRSCRGWKARRPTTYLV